MGKRCAAVPTTIRDATNTEDTTTDTTDILQDEKIRELAVADVLK